MLNKKIFLVASSLVILASCGGGKKIVSGSSDSTEAGFVKSVNDKVFFALDSSDLSSESKATLDKQAEWIKAHGHAHHLRLEGHADERGTREYNLALGERRANSAKKYLVSKGVEAARLETVSFGKEKPAVVGHDEAAWSQNRRAVTVVEGEDHHHHHEHQKHAHKHNAKKK
jgi:peptidoglycan-associated lipoprotein